MSDDNKPSPGPGPAPEPFVDDSPGWLREELLFARQAMREQADRIATLEADLEEYRKSDLAFQDLVAALEAQLRLSEAGAGGMRLALERAIKSEESPSHPGDPGHCARCENVYEYRRALASPAGSAFLERQRRLEEVAEAARKLEDCGRCFNCEGHLFALSDALGALDAEPKEGG